ncbi:DUF6318 family protein [Arthrobacter sp. RIT-PI-e]|uniref:DUF6318 family protein n=1 Tax=Arthrobacter sp. RIT-PI-e TaxID=1681197 RepID=UPI000AF842C5|nr:DUF6318 family protein [Arthrobacter sp. RIT-PI-e]
MFSVREQGRRREAPLLAGAAVATMLLLTACTGDAEPNAGGTVTGQASPSQSPAAVVTTAPSTPEPSPASSAGPAANIPLPVKPALADENSAEGLEAFTEYWLALFSYGYETNEWSEFEAVTDPGCRTCERVKQIVGDLYAEGRWMSGGVFEINTYTTDFVINTSGSIRSFVEYQQSEITYYETDGSLIPSDDSPEPALNATFAIYEDGHWVMLDFGKPEGT